MAEYFPLLERAIAGLQDATPDARRAIYDRARAALLNQLRAMDPPVPEADIERESLALDEAVTRLEANINKDKPSAAPTRPAMPIRPAAAAPPGLPVGTPPPITPAPVRERPAFPPRAPAPALTPRAAPALRPSLTPDAGASGETPPRAPLAPRPGVPPTRPGIPTRPIARPLGVAADPAATPLDPLRRQAESNDLRATPVAAEGAAAPEDAAGPVLPTQRSAPAIFAMDRPTDDFSARDDGLGLSRVRPADEVGIDPMARRIRDDGLRPQAPRGPAAGEPRGLGFYIGAGVVLLIVAGIAVAAWRLRDRPEKVIAPQTAGDTSANPGKVANRADNGGDGRASPTAPEAAGDTAVVPAPVPQGNQQAAASGATPPAAENPSSSTAPAPTAPPAPAAPPAPVPAAAPAETPAPAETTAQNADIPVSQRAALLVDAPEEPQKVKTYVGSVVWRNESVSSGQNQPLSTTVRADIDIPDAKLTLSMVIKKNLEPQFPASHTLEFHFTEQPGNTLGPVKQINVPEMRQDDAAPTGDPLVGVPVSITDDYFLVGLSRGAAEGHNVEMMKDRNWVDLSILLNSGKVAKVTFEKGTAGQRVLDDALKSWQ